MTELLVPEVVKAFLDTVRVQTDVITALSSGGVATILLTWARVLGIYTDADFSRFKRPALLVLPMVLFLVAIVLGYITGNTITGYLAEVIHGVKVDTCGETLESCEKINDTRLHFVNDYIDTLSMIGGLQLWTSITGVVATVIWFAANLLMSKKGTNS